jgi:hypothetical protein
MSAPSLRCLVSLVVLWTTAGFAARDCLAARIEAVAGKSYRLAAQHGPWMIMVATFHSTGADGQTDEGKSPQEAADELVLELRKQGLPAYVHEVENAADLIRVRDRLGQEVNRRNLRRVKSTCVLAGNYQGFDDPVAQQTLEWIKKFSPRSLTEGVAYRATPGRPLPLSGSFLCINPLRSPEDVAARRSDPLIKQLNSGVQYSLSQNRGKYTLVVAHFAGKQFTELRETRSADKFLTDNDLDDAAVNANELAIALRQDLDPLKQFRNLDAYVWHDHDHSIVTVGAFQSEHDPAIAHYRKQFAPIPNPATGRMEARYLSIPGDQPKVWAFTPTLQVMRVPQLD